MEEQGSYERREALSMQERYEVDGTGTLVRTRTGVMAGVYGWMSVGLAVTAVAALAVASSEAAFRLLVGTRFLFFALLIGELGLVWYLGARIMTMSTGAAKAGFLAYAALNGVTLSVIFAAFTTDSIGSVFFITAGMFAATSAFGYVTKRDLTGFGSFLYMGVIGVLIASVVNIFMNSPMVNWVVSVIGVFVFAGLSAYDTQKIKAIMLSVDESRAGNAAVLGALSLYLDFVNMFLFLLRLLGRNR
jgi:FtsH-binding integral membrane protein